jgi:hypothetical protein
LSASEKKPHLDQHGPCFTWRSLSSRLYVPWPSFRGVGAWKWNKSHHSAGGFATWIFAPASVAAQGDYVKKGQQRIDSGCGFVKMAGFQAEHWLISLLIRSGKVRYSGSFRLNQKKSDF